MASNFRLEDFEKTGSIIRKTKYPKLQNEMSKKIMELR